MTGETSQGVTGIPNPFEPSRIPTPPPWPNKPLEPNERLELKDLARGFLQAMLAGRLESQMEIDSRLWAKAAFDLAEAFLEEHRSRNR